MPAAHHRDAAAEACSPGARIRARALGSWTPGRRQRRREEFQTQAGGPSGTRAKDGWGRRSGAPTLPEAGAEECPLGTGAGATATAELGLARVSQRPRGAVPRAVLTEHLFAPLRVRLVGVDPLEVGPARAVAHNGARSAAQSAVHGSAPLHLSAQPRAARGPVCGSGRGRGRGLSRGRGQVRPRGARGGARGAGARPRPGAGGGCSPASITSAGRGTSSAPPAGVPDPQVVRGRPGALATPHPAWLAHGRSSGFTHAPAGGAPDLPAAQTPPAAPASRDEPGLAPTWGGGRGQEARDEMLANGRC